MGMWICGHGMAWGGMVWDGMGWAMDMWTCGHGMVWDGGQTAANSIQQEVMGWLVGGRYSGGFTEIDEGPWSNLSFLSQNPKPC